MDLLPAGREPVEAWTDGAAPHADVQQIRRAGWGLWIPDLPEACAAEPLHGPCQTAQRAEIRAFVAALERTGGRVKVWSDSRFVVHGAEYLAQGCLPPFHHGDLWRRAQAAWIPGLTEARWVPAHLEWNTAERRGVTWACWEGNRQADKRAVQGAASHAATPGDVARVLQARADLRTMQEWMVEALRLSCEAAEQVGRGQPTARRRRLHACERRGPLRQRQRGPPGDHGPIRLVGDTWHCDSCHRRVKVSRGWKEWRRIPCRVGLRQWPRSGLVARPEEVPAGRTSHDVRTVGGRTACLRCGCSRQTRWRSQLGALCPPALP